MSPPVIELLYVDDDDDHDNNDDYKDDGHDNNDDLIRTTNMIDMLIIREDPNGLTPPPFGHCPFGGGGGVLTLAQMVWGTYLEKNCPSSKFQALMQ